MLQVQEENSNLKQEIKKLNDQIETQNIKIEWAESVESEVKKTQQKLSGYKEEHDKMTKKIRQYENEIFDLNKHLTKYKQSNTKTSNILQFNKDELKINSKFDKKSIQEIQSTVTKFLVLIAEQEFDNEVINELKGYFNYLIELNKKIVKQVLTEKNNSSFVKEKNQELKQEMNRLKSKMQYLQFEMDESSEYINQIKQYLKNIKRQPQFSQKQTLQQQMNKSHYNEIKGHLQKFKQIPQQNSQTMPFKIYKSTQ